MTFTSKRPLTKLTRLVAVLIVGCLYTRVSVRLHSFNPILWPHERVGPLLLLAGTQEYGALHINTGLGGEPLRADGMLFDTGLGTHANSRITARVRGHAKSLAGACIYPDHVEAGQITCLIEGDGHVLFEGPALNSKNRREDFLVQVPDDRVLTLRIIATDNSLYQASGAWVNLH